MNTATEVVQGTVEMVKPGEATNWTGMELIPFETIAERFLDLEHEGQTATLTVSFGKPFAGPREGMGVSVPDQRAGTRSHHAGGRSGLGARDPDGDAHGSQRTERDGAAPHHEFPGDK